MRNLLLATATLAMVAMTVPATAQVRFEGGPGGVDVQIGPRHRDRVIHEYDRGYRAYGREHGCREVTVRRTLPNGTTVSRRSTKCGRDFD
jgi:hypothetical protein